MKKILFILMLAQTMLFAAENILDINNACKPDDNKPAASCVLSTGSIYPGHNFSLDNKTFFFFDTDIVFPKDGKNLKLRFVVWEDDRYYNTLQALVQTAYATRSQVSLIFVNPLAEVLDGNDSNFMKTLRKTSQSCFAYSNAEGYLYCPIQSLQMY